jgi:hypothetical protein
LREKIGDVERMLKAMIKSLENKNLNRDSECIPRGFCLQQCFACRGVSERIEIRQNSLRSLRGTAVRQNNPRSLLRGSSILESWTP